MKKVWKTCSNANRCCVRLEGGFTHSVCQGTILVVCPESLSCNHHHYLRRQIPFLLPLQMRKLRHREDIQLGCELRKSGTRVQALNHYTVIPLQEDVGWYLSSSPASKKLYYDHNEWCKKTKAKNLIFPSPKFHLFTSLINRLSFLLFGLCQ